MSTENDKNHSNGFNAWCGGCQNFTRLSNHSLQAIGLCKPFEDFQMIAKSERSIKNAFIALGNQYFFPGTEPNRNCKKFVSLG